MRSLWVGLRYRSCRCIVFSMESGDVHILPLTLSMCACCVSESTLSRILQCQVKCGGRSWDALFSFEHLISLMTAPTVLCCGTSYRPHTRRVRVFSECSRWAFNSVMHCIGDARLFCGHLFDPNYSPKLLRWPFFLIILSQPGIAEFIYILCDRAVINVTDTHW